MKKFKKDMAIMLIMIMVIGTQSLTAFADGEENAIEELVVSAENAETIENTEGTINTENAGKMGSTLVDEEFASENENVETEVSGENNGNPANEGVEADGIEAYAEEEVPKSGTCGDNLTWTLSNDGVLTISGTGVMKDYIYQNDDGYNESPFYACNSKKVIVEEGVTSIGSWAFSGCTNLSDILIPKSVTNIGNGAFEYCTNLEEIHIPEGVTSIGSWAFEGCTNLSEIHIPQSVVRIGEGGFAGCEKITRIQLPEGLKSLESSTFVGCKSLSAVYVPCSVENIGHGVFNGCSGMNEIWISEGVTSIEMWAFRDCINLRDIYIPDSVKSIGNGAFSGCYSLTEMHIPEGVTSIAEDTFYFCQSLADITIPSSVTRISGGAFYYCTSLREVEIPVSVTEIEGGVFSGCFALSSVFLKGDAPEISNYRGEGYNKEEAFTDVTAKIFYPSGNTTYTKDNMRDYGGNLTWVAYDSTDNLAIVLEVSDKVYYIGSGGDATIKCTGEFKDFVSVAVDGVLIDSSNYTVVEGSTVLTFLSSYLDTLFVGDHVVTLNYTYGSIDTTLTVLDRNTNASDSITTGNTNSTSNLVQGNLMQNSVPKTGDQTLKLPWVFVMLVTGCGCLVLTKERKRKSI